MYTKCNAVNTIRPIKNINNIKNMSLYNTEQQ